ncbi:MAG TPA: phosphotransferase [Ardenticatenaceae bacterium]|nr:phosphotransferase [Ardenticatenaceae bacterium]
MSEPFPPQAAATSTVELRSTLEGALGRHFGVPCRITAFERRPSAYRTSFAIEELDVQLDDGTVLQIMFKDLSRHGLPDFVRRAKPDFLYDPRREIETYRTILAGSDLGTATCYGAVADDAANRYWLFLEKVPGVELYQVGEFSTWQAVARWLAGLHERFAPEAAAGDAPGDSIQGHAPSPLHSVPLLRYDADFFSLWLSRALLFARAAEPFEARQARQALDWLAGRYGQVVERLAALPVTFIHGEFYAANVLVQEQADALRVCPVDWEMAAIGPGLLDLAARTAGQWTEEEKAAMAEAYRAAMPPASHIATDPATFWAALDFCHLHVAVQWLGWAPEWSPPAQTAHNWLDEALRLAEKLGL